VTEVGELRLEGVSKRYRDRTGTGGLVDALVDVDLRVGPDEAVGLIGPNGAGKSTILKVAAGVSAPSSGRIVRRGHTLAVIELGAGMHPDLTGRENLDLLATLSAGDRPLDAATLARIVAFADLEAFLDLPVRQYSTGMVARLAFSVAVHASPRILLVDEVLSVGDLDFQERCKQKLFELRADGVTVVVVSHDLELIGDTCDRAVLLVGGRVERDGPADEVIAHYLGRPARPAGDEALALDLERATVPVGEPVRARFRVPADRPVARARLDYVVPIHVALQADQGLSIVCGSAVLDDPARGPADVLLETASLPPGRYELHVSLEDEARRPVLSDALPFTLVGPPGPGAIRLRSRTTVDGSPAAVVDQGGTAP
jgi:ABC-type polysaccharide/polyol phosphate transport system ATPase subunit